VKHRGKHLLAMLFVLAWQLLSAPGARACAACFGQSDDPMAKGMNAGIYALLGVVTVVLGGFFALMIFLARRASSHGDVMAQRAEEIRMQLMNERATADA